MLRFAKRSRPTRIVAGQNHSPADIERALLGIAGVRSGRAVAFSVAGEASEPLVIAAEIEPKARRPVADIESEVRAAVLVRTGLSLHRFVPVAPGSLELTTSCKPPAFLAGTLALFTATRPLSSAS